MIALTFKGREKGTLFTKHFSTESEAKRELESEYTKELKKQVEKIRETLTEKVTATLSKDRCHATIKIKSNDNGSESIMEWKVKKYN